MKRKLRSEHKLIRQLTTLIMAQGLAATAMAQGAPAPDPAATSTNAPTKLPGVVVSGDREQSSDYKPEALSSPKYTVPLLDVPQTVTVVPQAVIQQQNATTLRDVLRNVPGISIQAGEGGVPAGDNLSIRGFSARTDLFIDGVRDFGGYSRDPFNFEQVEVAKGPASSYAGRGSTGGSVNLVSKTPQLAPSYGGSFGFGSDAYMRTTIDVNQPVGDIGSVKGNAVRLNAMWHDAEVAGRDAVENSRWGVAPSISFGLGTDTRATLSYFHLAQDNLPDYGVPWVPANTNPDLAAYSDQAPPVNFDNFYGLTTRDYEDIATDVATAILEHDFNDSLRLRNLTRYGRTDRDSVITAPRFASVNTSTDINRQIQSRDQVDAMLANQTDLRVDFDTGAVGHSLVTGLEFARETSDNRLRAGPAAPLADLFNPNPSDVYIGSVTNTGARNEATANSAAVYAFDTLRFGERWSLTGGLRWDHFEVDYRSTAANGAVTNLSRTDEMPSWRAGLTFKPQPNGTLYAAYGTSFNPSAEGLTLSNAGTAANNLNTDPEKSRTFELGAKWEVFDRRLLLSAAVFRTEKTNARTEDPADPTDIIVLEGEQRVDGVEFGFAGSITDRWNVFGGYTFLHSEITESQNAAEIGNELSNTPEHSFSLWTTYQFPGGIEIGGGTQFVDSRYSSNANTRQAPSYWLFDAMVAFHLSQNATLQLNLYNLADEDYIGSVGGGHFIPGTGRSAVLSANFRF